MIIVPFIIIVFILYASQSLTGDSEEIDESKESKLEQALMKIKGVGQVKIYFHYDDNSSANVLSDYFRGVEEKSNISGLLVVCEGASSPTVQKELLNIISRVTEVPAHRIMIVPMESKGDET